MEDFGDSGLKGLEPRMGSTKLLMEEQRFKEKKMRTLVKLIVLLALLAICMPAQGEILVYSKVYHCWGAEEIIDDGVDWDIWDYTQRGFLVLDVVFDEFGEVVGIEEAVQIEFWREDLRDKYYYVDGEDFFIERVDDGDEVFWVLEQLYGAEDEAEILMVKGNRPRMINIGLSRDRDDRREVARALSGYWLYLYLGEGIEKEMCTFSLRLHGRFTRLANSPDFGDQDFGTTIDAIIDWLEDRGYNGIL